ncbi:MAG: hypothetical protein LBI73_02030 [Myroides sp.]|jgi:hypothetical protein|nr:hypothetical protein [Myroides sp.]
MVNLSVPLLNTLVILSPHNAFTLPVFKQVIFLIAAAASVPIDNKTVDMSIQGMPSIINHPFLSNIDTSFSFPKIILLLIITRE